MDSLTKGIFYKKYGSDKFVSGIIDEYEKYFGEKIYGPKVVVEIGVLRLGFTRYLCEDYLANQKSRVIGIDANHRNPNHEKMICYKSLQTDIKELKRICEIEKNFDIVIDDASHKADATEISYDIFWKYLNPGGDYVIEDFSISGDMIDLINKISKYSDIDSFSIVNKHPKYSIAFFKKKGTV